ncbi:MAG: ExbD/TolR family protein [Planctomycetaceae bacterium]
MNSTFGPWTTGIHAEPGPQLSTFWRRRLTMLKHLSSSTCPNRPRLVGMLLLGAATLGLPTLTGEPAATAQPPATSAADEPAAALPAASADPFAPAQTDSGAPAGASSFAESDAPAAEPSKPSTELTVYLPKRGEKEDSLSFSVETFVQEPDQLFQALTELAHRDTGMTLTQITQIYPAGTPAEVLPEIERTDHHPKRAKYTISGTISRRTLDEDLKRLQRFSGAETLTIHADADTSMEELIELIRLAQPAGFTKFSFAAPESKPATSNPYSAAGEDPYGAPTYERSTTPFQERPR